MNLEAQLEKKLFFNLLTVKNDRKMLQKQHLGKNQNFAHYCK